MQCNSMDYELLCAENLWNPVFLAGVVVKIFLIFFIFKLITSMKIMHLWRCNLTCLMLWFSFAFMWNWSCFFFSIPYIVGSADMWTLFL